MRIHIKPQEAVSVINALTGGVVPSLGIQHITVGREQEVQTIIRALDDVKRGHSLVKFWIGEFGSGKSFILQLIKNIAVKKDFVVASADFTPELRLYANDRKAVALYSKLIRSLSTNTNPQGDALDSILSNWIENHLAQVAEAHQMHREEIMEEKNLHLVQEKIVQSCKAITNYGGYEFGVVISKYLESFVRGDEQLRQCVLKWLYGEYTALTDVRNDLGIRMLVDDRNYYDMLKNLAAFFKSINYKGFVINLDEAVNLYKIAQSPIREKNYEKLLAIYNDCLQNENAGLFLNIGGTRDFLTNERRGLFSYNALKTRLSGNNFETGDLQDYNQPVILLRPLSHDEIFYLLKLLKKVFEARYSTEVDLQEQEVQKFMENLLNREGSDSLLTPRDATREFLKLLNMLEQYPEQKQSILSKLNGSSRQATTDNIEIA